MKSLFTAIALCLLLSGYAQKSDPDFLDTNNGQLKIQPILHATLVVEWNNEVIYFDPYGGAEAFEGMEDPTLIYITDIHGDHMDLNTLGAINTDGAQLVVPQAVYDQLPEKLQASATVINNGETNTIKGIPTTALPMYNLPESEDSRHTKGRGNGYVVDLGGKTLYVSGDTEDIPEMRALENIDVAFVCMNLPYTMDIDQAASAVLEFQPEIVYPFHYRGSGGLNDVEGFQNMVNSDNDEIEVRLRNWYPE